MPACNTLLCVLTLCAGMDLEGPAVMNEHQGQWQRGWQRLMWTDKEMGGWCVGVCIVCVRVCDP